MVHEISLQARQEPTQEEIIACALYISQNHYDPQQADALIQDLLQTINNY
jgi:hypothetical protein